MVDTGSYIFTFGYVNAAQVIALSTVLPALCTVAVVLRFITRRKQKARLGADDWSIAMGLIFLLGMAISLIVGKFVSNCMAGANTYIRQARLRVQWATLHLRFQRA